MFIFFFQDGIIVQGEDCDDGNLAEGDGCDSACASEQSQFPAAGIAGIVIFSFVFLLCIVCFGVFAVVFLSPKHDNSEARAMMEETNIPVLDHIEIGSILGEGEFGKVFYLHFFFFLILVFLLTFRTCNKVYKGDWKGTQVALKSLISEQATEYRSELKIMSECRHPHVNSS